MKDKDIDTGTLSEGALGVQGCTAPPNFEKECIAPPNFDKDTNNAPPYGP